MTFDHPPIDTITATTVSELSELVTLVERDTRLNVILFDSANRDFFLAHYDVEGDPKRTSALPPGPTGMLRDETARLGLNPNRWFNNVERVTAERIGRQTVEYVSSIYKDYVAYKLAEERTAEAGPAH